MKRNTFMIWAMALLMLINVFLPLGAVYASELGTSALTDFTAKIMQDGTEIGEGDTITSTKPIRVEISFGVPVEGDDPTPDNPVRQGDTVSFALSSAFTLVSSDTIELKMGSLLVGHATFATDSDTGEVVATVTFDGDESVFNGDSNAVSCRFAADFVYDDDGESGNAGDHTVTILEKSYTVNVPEEPIEYTVDKEGTANLEEGTISWSVTVGATQGEEDIDLSGYAFYDDLQNVGEYVPGSFQIDGQDKPVVSENNTLSYVFPDNTLGEKTITFKTKIPAESYYENTEQTITNKAQLLKEDSTVVKEDEFDAVFTPKWIEKSGASSDVGSTGVYNPEDRTITWTITANQMEATLNNVVITDALTAPLTLKQAYWQSWNGTDWGTATPITPDSNGEYPIGNIDSKILLTVVTNVPDEDYTTAKKTYSNSASIKWDGLTGNGLGSGKINVGVGFNAIGKSGVADTANQKIRWTVNVDTKGQSIPSLKVYDLLVYGNSINLNTVTGIPTGISASDLTARYGQKYAGNFSGAFTVNIIPIFQDGERVADLVEISGLSTTVANTFKFDSQVVDPDIFAGNETKTVSNTATLFSANTKLNAATNSVKYKNQLLLKGLLSREAIDDPASAVNSAMTDDEGLGFNYQDMSVIFRLNVNADGIDLTGAVNAAGQTLGKATLTDTLPEGWEFTEIVAGGKYLIFEGTAQTNGNIAATDTTPDTVAGLSADISGRTATFTFTTLNKPYVILVKARPLSETAASYFDSNQETPVRNNVTLVTENWDTGASSYQDVTIKSQILDKTNEQASAGELRWTLTYNPYNISQPGEKLEDKLPLGIDLRTDSNGALLLEGGNITAHEMTLNADGTCSQGAEVALVDGENISYDNENRILSFTLPDSQKAYCLSYVTDVTGEPGTITNKVSLLGGGEQQEETSHPYVILEADGSASLQRNGWIGITKTDGLGEPLAGAEFTLYSADGSKVIKRGLTAGDGTLKLKVIPDGEYILKETAAPDGYALEGVAHTLVVSTSGGVVTSSIDGKTGAGSNQLEVQNFEEDTTGNLTIKKEVVGLAADTTKAFDFTLTLSGADGVYRYIGHGVPGGTISSGDTVSLAHGQSITVVGLPKDAAYQVSEADYSDEGYTAVSMDESGVILADETQEASFINRKDGVPFEGETGTLTITKEVAGNAADTTKAFDFMLTLTGAEGEYIYFGHGVPGGTISSGGTVSMAHGQSIIVVGLPEGTAYEVSEADYSADGYTMDSTGASGSIAEDENSEAVFVNTRNVQQTEQTGELTIQKTVAGDLGDRDQAFTFTVLLDADGVYPYSGSKTGTISSGQTITLKHGEFVVIAGIPEGASYQVSEAEAGQNGYTTTASGASGVIGPKGSTAAFVNTKNSVPQTGGDSSLGIWGIGLMAGVSALLIIGASNFVLRGRKRGQH